MSILGEMEISILRREFIEGDAKKWLELLARIKMEMKVALILTKYHCGMCPKVSKTTQKFYLPFM